MTTPLPDTPLSPPWALGVQLREGTAMVPHTKHQVS
jgi:hypothetical protein